MRLSARKSSRWLLVSALVIGSFSLSAPATADMTQSVSVAACYVSANSPYTAYTGQLKGRANRAGCGDSVRLTARLFKDIAFQPDPTIGSVSATLVNGSVTGTGPCRYYGQGNYYTAAQTDTRQYAESARAGLC
jgi:hypothetical protein